MSAARVFADQERIASFTILRLVSAGGMGEVYEAWDEELQRRIALKVLNDEMAADPKQLAAFKDEGRALARLHHKNVVTVHLLGQHNGRHFIAMEYVNGSHIHRFVQERNLDLRRTLQIFVQALEGLRIAHDAGVLHRDIKPHNIMVHTNGTVKIVDFGLSKIQTTLAIPAVMTQEWGTQEFTAPEVIRGEAATRPSDIFAMGRVFEVVTGKLSEHAELFNLIQRMTSSSPILRPQTADEVISALNRILELDKNLGQVTQPLVADDPTVLLQTPPTIQPEVSLATSKVSIFLRLLATAASLYGLFLMLNPRIIETGLQRILSEAENWPENSLSPGVSVPTPPVGTKFKYLYKIDSLDGQFTNEVTREWQISSASNEIVSWQDQSGNIETYSLNPFLPPKSAKVSASNPWSESEFKTNPLSLFPIKKDFAVPIVIRQTLNGVAGDFEWTCWHSGSERLTTSAGTFDVEIVSCMAKGAEQGLEIFKYSPAHNHWIARQRTGFGLPKMTAELISVAPTEPNGI